MYSVVGDTTSLVPGFPIRTSSDQRSVGSSPRHNAASHVLHRLPVPRHPPCALKHLQHKKPIRKKKLHIKNTQQTQRDLLRARCSQPLSTNQTPHPTTKDGATTRRPRQRGATRNPGHGPVVSKPNSVFGSTRQPPKGRSPSWTIACRAPDPHPLQVIRAVQRIA